MTERPLFFSNGAYDLFGVLHEPDTAEPSAPFVFCHPFVEEKLWSHRVFVTFARELALRGHPVLRFDYMGNGDSDGDFADCSVTTARADIGRAIEIVKHRTGAPRVGLLGLRFGATLAARGQRRAETMSSCWCSGRRLANGQSYMQELLRINLTTQMTAYREVRDDRDALVADMRTGRTANVDGYETVTADVRGGVGVAGARQPAVYRADCLVIDITRGAAQAPGPEASRFAAAYRNATVDVIREDPFWKEIERFYDTAPNLFVATLDWLAARPAGVPRTHDQRPPPARHRPRLRPGQDDHRNRARDRQAASSRRSWACSCAPASNQRLHGGRVAARRARSSRSARRIASTRGSS